MIIPKPQILHYLENMICHILFQMILLKRMTKNKNNDDEYKEETSKIQEGNGSVDNYETLYIFFVMILLSRQPNKEKH